MKHLVYISAVLFAAALVSCTREPAQEIQQEDGLMMTFTASWEDDAFTKSMINPDDSTKVLWVESDLFRIYSGTMSGQFYNMNADPSSEIEIRGGLVPIYGSSGDLGETYLAVFPNSAASDYVLKDPLKYINRTSVKVSVSTTQSAQPESFGLNAASAVAVSTGLQQFKFRNMCGGLRFTVEEPGIKAVKFSATGANEYLAGKMTVEVDDSNPANPQPVFTGTITDGVPSVTLTAPGDSTFTPGVHYYAMFLPGTVTNLSVIFIKAGTSTNTSIQKNLTVQRRHIGMIDNIDQGAWPSGSQIPTPTTVDLGTSVLWSTVNLGAAAPEAFGNYYAWGETETKDEYTWETYKWGQSERELTKYNSREEYGPIDNKYTLDSEDDAATAALGDGWRMPSPSEFNELRNYTDWTRETLNGIVGYRITGRGNYASNSIFLPITGYWQTYMSAMMDVGYYSTFISNETYYLTNQNETYSCYYARCYRLSTSSSVPDNVTTYRYYGLPIRPVKSRY